MVEEELQEETQVRQVPIITLRMDESGGWVIESNVKNPERILQLVGARLTIRALE